MTWTINDPSTRLCIDAMRANGGRWTPGTGWVFGSANDAANALAGLYRATRPTLDQRERLTEMISDGTAMASWELELDDLDAGWWQRLDRDEAARLIGLGKAARRVLGRHPLDDTPRYNDEQHLVCGIFEHDAEARRARLRRAR